MEQYVYMNYCPKCGSKLRPKNIDDAKRLACIENNCGFVHWNNPVPVVAALVQYGGKYVIARNVTWPKGIFSLITGYLEHNTERPLLAVSGLSNMNLVIGLLSVCFRPKADVRHGREWTVKQRSCYLSPLFSIGSNDDIKRPCRAVLVGNVKYLIGLHGAC